MSIPEDIPEDYQESFNCENCKIGSITLNKENIWECNKCDFKGWIFTFGFSQKYPNSYMIIYGTEDSARNKMFEMFGREWAFQYETKEQDGIEKFNFKEIKDDKN